MCNVNAFCTPVCEMYLWPIYENLPHVFLSIEAVSQVFTVVFTTYHSDEDKQG